MARVTVLSGLCVKGPAAILIETGTARLLLDLGRGPDLGAEVPLEGIGRVDAVLLTHGHRDHAGALDRLAELEDPPVWATAELRALHALPPGGVLPLQGRVEIAGVAVTTGRAGHAPGGVWIHLGLGDGLLYTGDLFDRSLIWDFDPPPPAGTLLVDASYGLDPTPFAERRRAILAALDAPCVLLPAPADGRALELAMFLASTTSRIPVLCPQTRASGARILARARASVRAWAAAALDALLARAPAWSENPQGVVVAAGATLEDGPAAALAARWVDHPHARIVLTGYVPRGSRARDLLSAGRAVFCRWPVHPDRATLEALVARVRPQRLVPLFDPEPDRDLWRKTFTGIAIVLERRLPL